MSAHANGKMSSEVCGFEYRLVSLKKAEKVRQIVRSIKEKIHCSLVGLIEAGKGLLTVKEILPHGQFGNWLEAEFGWTDRTARRRMDVADQFGSKTDIMSDLEIEPTAFYLLAAPSTPFEARQIALERAQSGERITPGIAKEIIWSAKEKPLGTGSSFRSEATADRLMKILKRFRDNCESDFVAGICPSTSGICQLSGKWQMQISRLWFTGRTTTLIPEHLFRIGNIYCGSIGPNLAPTPSMTKIAIKRVAITDLKKGRSSTDVADSNARPPTQINGYMMNANSESFIAGVAYQRAGHLQEAQSCFRQVTAQDPCHIEAWSRLGETCQSLSQPEAAAEAFRQALTLDIHDPAAHNNLGVALMNLGNHKEALNAFEKALSIAPDYADAHNNRGIALLICKDVVDAERSIRRAVEIRRDYPDAWNNLGMTLLRQSRPQEALVAFQEALRLFPDFGKAHANHGKALAALGRYAEATSALAEALKSQPNDAGLHNELGVLYLKQSQHDDAANHFRQAVQARPEFSEALNNLGSALLELRQYEQAVEYIEKALLARPSDAIILYNLSVALARVGRADDALAKIRHALRIRPDYSEAWNNLGNALRENGRNDEAIFCYRRGLAVAPDSPVIISNLLYALQAAPNIRTNVISKESQRYGERLEAATTVPFVAPRCAKSRSRLRVGYVSPDFRRHVLGFFSALLMPAHDRNNFEIICYSDAKQTDEVTGRIREGADQWVDLGGLSTDEALKKIRADEIDILVDLAGHTAGNRMPVFAQRAAPVQCTLYGFLATTGLKTIDYFITDAFLHPTGLPEKLHSERLVRLPDILWCYAGGVNEDPGPAPFTQNGYITFASLNHPSKMNKEQIGIWAQVLQVVPNSRMTLMGGNGRFGVEWLLDQFALHGIESRRLQIIGRRSRGDYFRLYQDIDICLDTFPYGGCNTTADALWMGIPVVTQAAKHSISRQGVGPLSLVGVKELIAGCSREYVSIAIKLAEDFGKLQTLRSVLRARLKSSPLMNVRAFKSQLEKAYQQMWTEKTKCPIQANTLTILEKKSIFGDESRLVTRESNFSGLAKPFVGISPKVSLCMITKNEEDAIQSCLALVANLVDEIVVVDTGSTDDTKNRAQAFGAKTFDFKWQDSFAAARNESLARATGKWILWLDADDRFDSQNHSKLGQLLSNLPAENNAYTMCQASECNEVDTTGVVLSIRFAFFVNFQAYSGITVCMSKYPELCSEVVHEYFEPISSFDI